ncbi:STAS domain-containing protein [Tropicimonas marinistellae]|uniref:STAS domain-containing protein n=1 Tax=Tropicimonas marinistellae TaxID=1739787 RepID=UPI00082E74DC|nr:STAS domain-containing protein [Tropicimonas marinistellae]
MTARLSLPARLDLPAAAPLAQELLSLRGSPVTLCGDEVSLLGTPCLQVLVSARRSWDADGFSLTLTDPSPALTEQLAVLGFTPADLESTPTEH